MKEDFINVFKFYRLYRVTHKECNFNDDFGVKLLFNACVLPPFNEWISILFINLATLIVRDQVVKG